jgi:aminoglycoside phosphotransferase (APT) family kinase protein
VIKMHADEVDTDSSLVRRLLAAQFPQWAELTIEPVELRGTDNALYRLGNDMVVRLPRRERTVGTLEKERAWLPRLAPSLTLAVPTPLAEGKPTEDYAWTWSVYSWLDGENATADRLADLGRAATDLARFVAALQRIDTTGGLVRANTTSSEARLSVTGTLVSAPRSRPCTARSTSVPSPQSGRQPSARPRGTALPCGYTETSTRATCLPWRVA